MVAEDNLSSCSWFHLSWGHWRGSGERLHYMSLSGCSGVTCTGLCSSAASPYLHEKKGAMLILGKMSQVVQSLLYRNCWNKLGSCWLWWVRACAWQGLGLWFAGCSYVPWWLAVTAYKSNTDADPVVFFHTLRYMMQEQAEICSSYRRYKEIRYKEKCLWTGTQSEVLLMDKGREVSSNRSDSKLLIKT